MGLLFAARNPPERLEIWNHSRSDKRRFSAGQLAVIDLAAPENFVFEKPRVRALGVFLNIPGHDRVAAAAYGYVQRGPGLSGIRKARGKANTFDEAFRMDGGFDATRTFALPSHIAILFDLFR